MNIFVSMKRHWFDESWQRRRRKNNEHCVNIRFTLHWICVHSMNGFDITKRFNGETVPPKKNFSEQFLLENMSAPKKCVCFFSLSIFFRIPFQCSHICSVLLVIIMNSFHTTHFRQQHIASKQIHQYSRGNRTVEKKNGKLSSSYCVWFLHDNLVLAFCMKKKQTEFERDCYVFFLFWFLRFQIFNRNFIQTKKKYKWLYGFMNCCYSII